MKETIQEQINDLKQEIRKAYPLERLLLLAKLQFLCSLRDSKTYKDH